MKTLRACLARLGGLFNRDSRDRDLAEELASHVALHIDDNLRSGMTPEEARRAAYIRLGGVESVKETVREQRGFPVIDSFLRDVRYSLRGLRRDRAFTLTAIVTLALAIGLNVTVFSRVKLIGHGRDALLKFEQAVREHPEILECYTMMGETDFMLRIVCRDIKAYEAFFLDHLSRFPGVQSVNSSIAMAIVKETTALPLATISNIAPR